MPKPTYINRNQEKDDGDERFYKMLSKREGPCAECEQDIRISELIVYDSQEGKAYHYECGSSLLP